MKQGTLAMTSAPGSRIVLSTAFIAPLAPQDMTTCSAPRETPCSEAACAATRARTSG